MLHFAPRNAIVRAALRTYERQPLSFSLIYTLRSFSFITPFLLQRATSGVNNDDERSRSITKEHPPSPPIPSSPTKVPPYTPSNNKAPNSQKLIDLSVKRTISLLYGDGRPVHEPIKIMNNFEETLPYLPPWLSRGLQAMKYTRTTDIQSHTIPFLLPLNKKNISHSDPNNSVDSSVGGGNMAADSLYDGTADMIGLAPTGSGKTVSFALPLLTQFQRNQTGHPAVLVLAPVRELVHQTAKVFRDLSQFTNEGLSTEEAALNSLTSPLIVAEAYGGSENRRCQLETICQGCDVLVACPGRLLDFVSNGVVNLTSLQYLVFDEADRLLDMGFKPQIEEIIAAIKGKKPGCEGEGDWSTAASGAGSWGGGGRCGATSSFDLSQQNEFLRKAPRCLMWSATWGKDVQKLANEYLSKKRVIIKAGNSDSGGARINSNINQQVFVVKGYAEKMRALEQIIDEEALTETQKVIIFVDKQLDCEKVATQLINRFGIDPNVIGLMHGGNTQSRREKVLSAFRESRLRILIATDVAARGLDVPDVSIIINFDIPKTLDTYCHRIGRTARAGRSGKSFTLFNIQINPAVVQFGNPLALARPLMEYLIKCQMPVSRELKEVAEEFDVMDQEQRAMKMEKKWENEQQRRGARVDRGGKGWGARNESRDRYNNNNGSVWRGGRGQSNSERGSMRDGGAQFENTAMWGNYEKRIENSDEW